MVVNMHNFDNAFTRTVYFYGKCMFEHECRLLATAESFSLGKKEEKKTVMTPHVIYTSAIFQLIISLLDWNGEKKEMEEDKRSDDIYLG